MYFKALSNLKGYFEKNISNELYFKSALISISNRKLNYYNIVSIIGIMVCVLWIIFVDTQPYSDFSYYNELAKEIAAGKGWGDTYTAAGYSVFLGLLYYIFGQGLITAKAANIVLTLINYVLFYNILKKVDMDEKQRRFIYTLFIFFPNNIFYTGITGNEILFTTILLAITMTYYSGIKLKYILIGVLVGVNTMIKPFFIMFFLVILVLELCLRMNIKSVLMHALTVLVISLICISPWVYRNTKLVGHLTYISNNGGVVLYINNNSQNRYGRWMPAEKVENSIVLKEEYIKADMTEKNNMLCAAAKEWIAGHPLKFMGLGFKRLINVYFIADDVLFVFFGTGINIYFKIFIILLAFIIKLALFIPAIFYIIKYSIRTIISLFNKKTVNSFGIYCLACFYAFSGVYFITEGQGRYAFPFTFIIIYFFSLLLEEARNTKQLTVKN